jgi:hypothetical protein
MTSESPKSAPQFGGSTRIYLEVRGLGHVPSKKNTYNPVGNRVLLDQKAREWIARCQQSLLSQLLSKCPTDEGGTLTAHSLHSLIASLPSDDNCSIMRRECIQVLDVKAGEEGAEIILERIG